ncbi:hypothetical protein BDB00DRAFT_925785 [Zychaea mexicana]|uniref:uncharacterized protein n=1 Tax=Zychaea mexicana TaxID=64656 RepID=UPI0022FDCDC5|nr:uncharacterized protein BDB00DRAFT_925785 [Zychaea mexicana]KAI9497683.1 hypothetical protein BDB00DRAFT_925785 [Zychaea mexicana]
MTTPVTTKKDPFQEALKKYFDLEKGTASLKNFHAFDPTFIANNSHFKNVQSTWMEIFRKQVKDCGVEDWNKDEPEWIGIMEEIIKKIIASSTGKANVAKSPSSSNTTTKPTEKRR